MKPTTKTSKVRLFGRDTSATSDGIASPYGAMLPGAAYDRYATLSVLRDALASLHTDMAGMVLTRPEALARVQALPMPASTYTSIEQAVAGLRTALTDGTGDIPRLLGNLKGGINQLSTAVMFAAGEVPKPTPANAVQPITGQRLGTGAYQRSEEW